MGIDPRIYTMPEKEIRCLLFGDRKDYSSGCKDNDKQEKLRALLTTYPIRKRKICLIQPPGIYPDYVRKEVAKNQRYTVYFPYGLLSLSAAVTLFHRRWEVIIKDLFLELVKRVAEDENTDFNSLLNTLPEDCDVYGISYMQSTVERQVLEITSYLKSKGKFVIAGGVQCTNADSTNLLKTGTVDVCFKRESETQMVRFLHFWEEVCGRSPRRSENSTGMVNLEFKSGKEIVSFADVFESIVSLDIREEYKKIDIDAYNNYASAGMWSRIAGRSRKYANIMSNRGCRGKCSFCSVSYFMKPGVRSRSAQDVLDEIIYLYNTFGIRHIEWLDDDLLGNRKRSLELFTRLAALDLDVTWSTNHFVLAHSISEELAKAMVDSGCVMIGFGVETGNEQRMKTLGKRISKKIIREAVDTFRSNHPQVMVATAWIFGFPNETFGELFDSFDFAKELKVDWCSNSMLQPLPGTGMYNELQKMGDERTTGKFGARKSSVYTIGREAVSKGYTFDDIFKEIIDFRIVDQEAIATKSEIQQFQIYFNVFVNLLGNVNLTAEGNPEKIKRHTDDILKGYPMDTAAWLVNARASRLLGLTEHYDNSMRNYEIARNQSTFWTRFFELYAIQDYFNEADNI